MVYILHLITNKGVKMSKKQSVEVRCAECFIPLDGVVNTNNKGMCDKCLTDHVAPRYDNSEEDVAWVEPYKQTWDMDFFKDMK